MCLWKPAQSGKTRTIQQIIRDDDGVRNHLNILICSNNRLLVAQTNARMVDDLYDDVGSVEEDGPSDDHVSGGVYSWMSGTKKSNISVDALAWKVCNEEVSMIVCCAHKARFRMLTELLTKLEASRFFSKPVNVWIDEADVSVKHWSGDYDFSNFSSVREMTLVSATFGAVFDHYERIRVMPFPETCPATYLGLSDCDLQPFDAPGRAAEYVDAVLTAHPEMLKRGIKLFIPGDIERKSHTAIADYLTARNCIVLVLNGETKAFLFPNGRRVDIDLTLDEENPTELSRVLAEMYVQHRMERYPLAVTGQLCLGRGITFQSPTFTFDYAIIPGMKGADSAYQCVARVLGNIRTYTAWTPTVFMSSSLLAAVLRQERIATNLARLVHENEWVDVGREQIAEAAGDPEEQQVHQSISHLEEFTSMDEVRERWTEILAENGQPAQRAPGTPQKDEDGAYVCSIGGHSEKQTARAIRAAFPDGGSTANWGSGITNAAVGEYVKRVYAGYTQKGSVRFFLRWAVKV